MTSLSRALLYRIPPQSKHRPYGTLSVMVNLSPPPNKTWNARLHPSHTHDRFHPIS